MLRYDQEHPISNASQKYERGSVLSVCLQNLTLTSVLTSSRLPDNAIYHFVKLAKDNGIDIFRVFDGLNDISNLAVGIKAALQAGAVVEGAILVSIVQVQKQRERIPLMVPPQLVHRGHAQRQQI